jgi:hypothetical protein
MEQRKYKKYQNIRICRKGIWKLLTWKQLYMVIKCIPLVFCAGEKIIIFFDEFCALSKFRSLEHHMHTIFFSIF